MLLGKTKQKQTNKTLSRENGVDYLLARNRWPQSRAKCLINPFTAMSLENAPKSAKSETLKLFCFLFALACERNFIKTHSIQSRWVTEPENILSAGASVHLSNRKFYRLRQ